MRIARFPFGTDCAGLPEPTLLLGADLSPHQAMFNFARDGVPFGGVEDFLTTIPRQHSDDWRKSLFLINRCVG